jgi:type I restriction enzyme S subunit
MASESWLEWPFEEVIDFQEGPGILAKDFCDDGVPLVRLSGLERGASVLEGCNYLDPKSVEKRWAHFALQQGDILLSTSASLGRIAVVDADAVGAIPYTGIIRMRSRDERLYGPFIRYLLEGPDFQQQADMVGVGSVIRHFGPMHLRQMKVRLPAPSEQRAMTHILGTLDDKLELNRRTNGTLETMARAIFRSWFEEVSPNRAKADDLIRDGVLEIGDGYRAKNSEIGTPGLPFIRAGDLNNGIDTSGAEVLRHESVARAGTKVSRSGDVAFTSKGTIGRFARVTDGTEPCVYSPQVCFWRSLDRQKLHPAVLYCWMQSGDFMSQVEAVAGQTDMAPYVSLRDQRRMDVPLFPDSQQAVGAQIERLLARQALAATESRCLGTLRDALLPKLISGELRLKDVERFTERARA